MVSAMTDVFIVSVPCVFCAKSVPVRARLVSDERIVAALDEAIELHRAECEFPERWEQGEELSGTI
jgi:hypothetical protein